MSNTLDKDIDINHTMIKVPVRITVDGKNYPIHKWNIEVVNKYWESKDESELDRLKDFSLDLG